MKVNDSEGFVPVKAREVTSNMSIVSMVTIRTIVMAINQTMTMMTLAETMAPINSSNYLKRAKLFWKQLLALTWNTNQSSTGYQTW